MNRPLSSRDPVHDLVDRFCRNVSREELAVRLAESNGLSVQAMCAVLPDRWPTRPRSLHPSTHQDVWIVRSVGMVVLVRDSEPVGTLATLGCSWPVRCRPSVVDARVLFGPFAVGEGEAVVAVPTVSLHPQPFD